MTNHRTARDRRDQSFARSVIAEAERRRRTQITQTRCLFCGIGLEWSAIFCASAPKDFNYFNCGQHNEMTYEEAVMTSEGYPPESESDAECPRCQNTGRVCRVCESSEEECQCPHFSEGVDCPVCQKEQR